MKTVLLVTAIVGLVAVAYVTAQNATTTVTASANASATVGNGTVNASTSASATVGNGTLNASTIASATVGNGTVKASTATLATLGNGTVNASTSASATLGNGTANATGSISINGTNISVSINASVSIVWKPLYDYLFNNVSQSTCTTTCPTGQVCRKRLARFNLQCGAGAGVGNNYTLPGVALAAVTARYVTLGFQYGSWAATNWLCILWRGAAACTGNPMPLIQGCYCAYNTTSGPLAYNNATSTCVPIYSCPQGSFSFY